MLGDAEPGIASRQFLRVKPAMTNRATDDLGDRVCHLLIGNGPGSGQHMAAKRKRRINQGLYGYRGKAVGHRRHCPGLLLFPKTIHF